MSNIGFKTPRFVSTDNMEDGRTAEELRTEIRAFKAALAQEQGDTASVAGSTTTTDEHNFFKMQTDVEKKKAQAALAEAAVVVGAEGEATVGDAAIDAVEEGAEGASEVINPLVQQSPPT